MLNEAYSRGITLGNISRPRQVPHADTDPGRAQTPEIKDGRAVLEDERLQVQQLKNELMQLKSELQRRVRQFVRRRLDHLFVVLRVLNTRKHPMSLDSLTRAVTAIPEFRNRYHGKRSTVFGLLEFSIEWGFVARPERGHYELTEQGRDFLSREMAASPDAAPACEGGETA